MSVDAAVVIVSYNTAHILPESLASLQKERGQLNQQVVVIDNGSTDGSVEMLRAMPDVTLIDAGENLGFGRAVNRAAAQVDAEFVVLLNPDTLVLDNAIERLVAFARANPGHGLYGGRTVHRDGTVEKSSCWNLPTVWSVTCFALGLTTMFKGSRLFDHESIPGWERDSVREIEMISGCLLLVPMTVWRQLGGFDERFFMYGEDADLAFRARALGYRPLMTPEACIVHDVGGASATRAAKLLLLYQGKSTLFRSHFSGWRQRLALAALWAGVGLRSTLSSLGLSKRREASAWSEIWRVRERWMRGYAPATDY